MKINMPETVSSPQDLQSLILEVHDYARWFAHESVKKQLEASKVLEAPALSMAATAVLREWQGKEALTTEVLDKLTVELEAFADKSPVISITLAGPPAAGLKKTLVAWCRQNVAPQVLVNFDFNSTLLGGMVVRSGSRIFDWSFRRQILENRTKFPEVLRRV